MFGSEVQGAVLDQGLEFGGFPLGLELGFLF